MAINFPTSPTVGDTYTVNSVVYTWDGTKWNASTGFVSYTYADKIQEGDSSAEIVDNGGDAYFVVTNNAVEKFRVNVDGQLGTPYAGNASSPALYMGGDINSGLYSAGADQVAVATNGVGRLFVDASGNVGVGTASPAAPLHINSGTSNLCATLESSDVGAGISFKDNVSTGFNGIQVDRDDMRVFTANAEKLRITSAGLVGIGTSAPATNLHIASTNAQLRLQDTDGTNQFGQISQSNGILYFFNRNNVSYGEIRFQQNNGTTTLTPLTIDSSQRVGIGTASPGQALDVSGSIAATGSMLAGVGTAAAPAFSFAGDPDGGMFRPSVNNIAFATLGTEAFRVDNAQRLLVGTTSAVVDGFQNDLKVAQLSKGSSLGTISCISDTREVAAISNSTVDAWVGRKANGSPYNQSMAGHFYVNVGGGNMFTGVYSIVTSSLGTSYATLTAVSTVTRGTSPVSSVQIASDGSGGAIKLRITYINNAGVVNGLTSTVSFVGLAG